MKSELIVMLTYNDRTIPNALDVAKECINSKAQCFGCKEEGIPVDELKELFQFLKDHQKTTFLEVVTYDEEECLKGVQIGITCQVDYIIGTKYFDSVKELCHKHHIKYMPYIGEVVERPSILKGSITSIIDEAKTLENQVDGFDLLGYRYIEDAYTLNKAFLSEIHLPVVIAGSINSCQRLDEIKTLQPDYYTIGSAFIDHLFGEDITTQINKVIEYVKAV